jgi:cytochrome c553
MSIYLKDLLEGLRRKESPNNVMEQAAERYSCQWGKDKVQRWAGK